MWFCQLDGHSHHGPMFWPGGERLRLLSEDLLNIVLKEMKYCCLNTKQISLASLHKHAWRKVVLYYVRLEQSSFWKPSNFWIFSNSTAANVVSKQPAPGTRNGWYRRCFKDCKTAEHTSFSSSKPSSSGAHKTSVDISGCVVECGIKWIYLKEVKWVGIKAQKYLWIRCRLHLSLLPFLVYGQ